MIIKMHADQCYHYTIGISCLIQTSDSSTRFAKGKGIFNSWKVLRIAIGLRAIQPSRKRTKGEEHKLCRILEIIWNFANA